MANGSDAADEGLVLQKLEEARHLFDVYRTIVETAQLAQICVDEPSEWDEFVIQPLTMTVGTGHELAV